MPTNWIHSNTERQKPIQPRCVSFFSSFFRFSSPSPLLSLSLLFSPLLFFSSIAGEPKTHNLKEKKLKMVKWFENRTACGQWQNYGFKLFMSFFDLYSVGYFMCVEYVTTKFLAGYRFIFVCCSVMEWFYWNICLYLILLSLLNQPMCINYCVIDCLGFNVCAIHFLCLLYGDVASASCCYATIGFGIVLIFFCISSQ